MEWPTPSKKVFDSVLGVDTASIDSGVVIPGGYDILEVHILARTDAAGPGDSVDIILNNDTGSNYDQQIMLAANVNLVGSASLAQTHWRFDTNAGGTAGYAGLCILTFTGYSLTTFNKVGTMFATRLDATAANDTVFANGCGWRSTAAINQVKLSAESTNKLKAGSFLKIFVR